MILSLFSYIEQQVSYNCGIEFKFIKSSFILFCCGAQASAKHSCPWYNYYIHILYASGKSLMAMVSKLMIVRHAAKKLIAAWHKKHLQPLL